MFGVEEKKVPLPYVETQNAKHGVISAFPKWKYHPDYKQGVVVVDETEEASLGDGWSDTPAAFGVETCPAFDRNDKIAVHLAEVRGIVERAKKAKSKAKE